MKFLIPYLMMFISGSVSGQLMDTTLSISGISCPCKIEVGEEEKIYDIVEDPASYPHGKKAWNKFIKQNIRREGLIEEKLEIQFVVNKYGKISDIRRITNIDENSFQELKRLILLSGAWMPAKHKGKCVTSYRRLEINLKKIG